VTPKDNEVLKIRDLSGVYLIGYNSTTILVVK